MQLNRTPYTAEEYEDLFRRLELALELFNKHLEEMQGSLTYREQHKLEHEFLRTKMKEAELRAARWEKIIPNVLSMGIWTTLVLIGTAIWFYIKDAISGTNPIG